MAVASKRAGVPHWHPHLLRHNFATEVQRRYESDHAAAAAIGDTPEVARQVYADSPEDAVAFRVAIAVRQVVVEMGTARCIQKCGRMKGRSP